MHDIQFIRDNPQAFDDALKKRNIGPLAKEILNIDLTYEIAVAIQDLQQKRNQVSKEIAF